MKQFVKKSHLLAVALIVCLSLPLLDGGFSAQCNKMAGESTVTVLSSSDLPSLSAVDDLQGGWRIFSWKIWGYVADVIDVVEWINDAYDVVTNVICWFDGAHAESNIQLTPALVKQAMLLQELD